MNTIRAWYKSADGKTRRGHQIHINDNGLPLCRCRAREVFTASAAESWLLGWDKPTCPVCIRMEKRKLVSS